MELAEMREPGVYTISFGWLDVALKTCKYILCEQELLIIGTAASSRHYSNTLRDGLTAVTSCIVLNLNNLMGDLYFLSKFRTQVTRIILNKHFTMFSRGFLT